jgi:hypothetical protein
MPPIFRSMFAINNINNGNLSSMHAMPQKDITSDNTSDFSNDRHKYFQSLDTTTITAAQKNHKKWLGSKDASTVTQNRRVNEVGVGSMNANKQTISFTTNRDTTNTVTDAKRRMRSQGSGVPVKCSHRPNKLTPSFQVGTLIRTQYNCVENAQEQTFNKNTNWVVPRYH